MPVPSPYLLLPLFWSSRNRARRRQPGDLLRGVAFGGIGLGICVVLFLGAAWLTAQVNEYDELGDYLLRLGLSWVFLTFLSFLAFSGLVTALSTFFLSDDLRLLLVAPVASRRLFYARFARTAAQASWMVLIFLAPVLAGIGYARCAPPSFFVYAALTMVPFAIIPVAVGSAITLVLVNIFPARRARDILMLAGLLFAAALVVLLRVIRPEQLLRIESLPDVAGFITSLQGPVTPLLPSFWAGETLFASLQGHADWLHASALWSTALAMTVALRIAHERWYFAGYSRSQEAPRARFAHFRTLDRVIRALPVRRMRRELLLKDVKVFLRDVSQWSQLLLLVALMLVYLYNFRVLDLQRIPYMSGFLKNIYAFVNLGMAGLVMATVAVRFVFPAVSSEGAAFWIIRAAPVPIGDFLWSKFWTSLVPLFLMTEGLTVVGNEFLGVDPFLKATSAGAIVFLCIALVGLAIGMGARYPRFGASATEAAGSYGGVAFMIQAVLIVLATIALLGWPSSAYLWSRIRHMPLRPEHIVWMSICYLSVACGSVLICWRSMRSGVRALEASG